MGLYKRLGFLLMSSILPIVILSCLNDMLPQSYAQIISPGGEIRGGSLGPSITLDRYGSIYVADSGSHKIQKFNGAGTFLAGWVYMSKTAAKPIVAGTLSGNGSRGAASAGASGDGESSSQSSIPGLGL